MARRACLGLILGLVPATSSSAFAPAPIYREPPRPKVSDVHALMQGTWKVTKNGDTNKAIHRLLGIRVEGSTWELIYDVCPVERKKHGIALDTKAIPATLDILRASRIFSFNGGPVLPEGTALQGIVKVEDNTLTFCFFPPPLDPQHARPRSFDVGPPFLANGPDARRITLKRLE